MLHCPLHASQRSRLWLLRHGNHLCQLFSKMWTSMHPTHSTHVHRSKYSSLFYTSFIPAFASSFKHQVYVASSDPQVCCGSCKNVSCTFTNENGTTELFVVRTNTSTSPFAQCSFLSGNTDSDFVCAGRELLGRELYTL